MAILALIHALVGTLWLGSMAYSLFVVQPRIARVLRNPEQAEDLYRELGAGNRWRVIGLIGVLLLSGFGLAALARPAAATGWWDRRRRQGGAVAWCERTVLVGIRWRGWPRTGVLAPAELPGVPAAVPVRRDRHARPGRCRVRPRRAGRTSFAERPVTLLMFCVTYRVTLLTAGPRGSARYVGRCSSSAARSAVVERPATNW